MSNFVSIIIPVYDRFTELRECLNSCFSQKNVSFEIIIVSNGSSKKENKKITSFVKKYSNVFLFILPKKGPNVARNYGVLKSKGEYILFLDSDSILEKSTLIQNSLKRLCSSNDIGQVGGSYLENENPSGMNISGKTFLVDSDELVVDYVSTNNVMIRKKEFIPFYSFLKGAWLDAPLGLQLQSKGFKNIVSRNTSVLHKKSPHRRNELGVNTQSDFERHKWKIRNRFYYLVKHVRVDIFTEDYINFMFKQVAGLYSHIVQNILSFILNKNLRTDSTSFFHKCHFLLFHIWVILFDSPSYNFFFQLWRKHDE